MRLDTPVLIRSIPITLAVIMAVSIPAAAVASGSEAPSAPPGKQMSASEVRKLYRGKTWMWNDGGGYFAPDGRFQAAMGSDRDTGSFVTGTWQVRRSGRLCFAGAWTVQGKRSYDTSCFAHRVVGNVIYQRKEPSGDWYVFRSEPPKPEDEIKKLIGGDQIEAKLKALRQSR
jgi:hypothetical protein